MIALLAGLCGVKRLAEHGLDGLAAAGIVTGAAVAVGFLRRQATAPHPLIDLRLFRAPALNVAVAAMVLATFVMAGMLLFVAQYLQLVREMGPLQAGVWMVPVMLGNIAGSMLAPALTGRLRPAILLPGAMALAASGLAIMSTVTVGPALALLAGGAVVMGIGAGAIGTVATDVITGTAPPERAGAASAISETGAELGGALGIALLGSIGTVVYRTQVSGAMPDGMPAGAADAARDTPGGAIGAADTLPAAALEAASLAFTDALQVAALTGALLMAATAAVAALIAHRGAVRTGPRPDARPSVPAEAHAWSGVELGGQRCLPRGGWWYSWTGRRRGRWPAVAALSRRHPPERGPYPASRPVTGSACASCPEVLQNRCEGRSRTERSTS